MDLHLTHSDLFHSARLKLTAFYFAVIAVFCVLLTFGVRAAIIHELGRGDNARLGAVHQLFQRYYDIDNLPATGVPDDSYFTNAQQRQADLTRQNLTRDFVLINLGLMACGAVLSYWYAGRTLRPIAEAHEQQRRFTSDASHELRTPLASMKLENEVFLRQKHFDEQDARAQIASNLEEVERLEKLATNLLSLNKYEHGDMAHAPVAVNALVQDAIVRVRRRKDAKKVRFNQDIIPATVDVNRDSVAELLTILLDNAVVYGPKGGPVDITGRMQDEQYIITVRDHGTGIADEDLPHIFERMYRGDKARSTKAGGHGIGLSLARQIASANDATIEARNAEGGGAEFVLTLQ